MVPGMDFVQEKPEGVMFKVLVQPKSSKNEVVGLHDGALKVKLTAPPVDGAANKLCLKFLAKQLGTAKSNIDIVSGETGRHKQLLWRFSDGDGSKAEATRMKRVLANLVAE